MPKDSAADQPAWLGPVKAAVVIMSVLIVLGVGLLVYGISTGIQDLESGHSPLTLRFPEQMEPVSVSPAGDGEVMVLFKQGRADSAWVAVTVDPGSREITGRMTLSPWHGDDFEIGE